VAVTLAVTVTMAVMSAEADTPNGEMAKWRKCSTSELYDHCYDVEGGNSVMALVKRVADLELLVSFAA